jgi:predicted nucleic acid-binding protein
VSLVVDSSVWIDFFNGRRTSQTARLDAYLGSERIVVGDLVLCEVLRGFRHTADARRADQLLATCESATFGGEVIARRAADHYRRLRAQGISVRKTVDLLIGTWCLEHDMKLLHNDRDFHTMVQHLGLREG